MACGSYSSVLVVALSLEDIFQELESKLDNKINQLIADKTVELKEKVTQLEIQLELNVSPFFC